MFKKVSRFININICTSNLDKSTINLLNQVVSGKPGNNFCILHVVKKGITSKYCLFLHCIASMSSKEDVKSKNSKTPLESVKESREVNRNLVNYSK